MQFYLLENEKKEYFKSYFGVVETTKFIETACRFFSAPEAKMFKDYYLLEHFKIKKITVF